MKPSVLGAVPDAGRGGQEHQRRHPAKLSHRMIWSRFMASQMADRQQDTVSVTVSAANYHFKASGYTVIWTAFTALYEEATDEKEKKETNLPRWSRDRCSSSRELKSEQKFTQPPARYTRLPSSRRWKKNGIGRPSTYAPIITTIIDRGCGARTRKNSSLHLLGRAVMV